LALNADLPIGGRLRILAGRLEIIEAVKEGLASVDRGEGRPMDEVVDALEKKPRSKARP
jgi:predicted transcriptional regulator